MLTIKGGQSNLSIVFIFVSCQENGYYRVVSVGRLRLTAASTAGAAAVNESMDRAATEVHKLAKNNETNICQYGPNKQIQ